MDIEKAMQFIVDSQARTSATLAELAERQIKAEARADRADARMNRFDKSLEGIRKMIQVGMKMMVQNQQAIKELTAAQKQTERRLNAFLASMEKGRNGRNHT
jgi:chromosome segregation ATPase